MGKLVRFQRMEKAKDEAARTLFPPPAPGATDARPASYASDAATSLHAGRAGAAPDPEIERKRIRQQRSAIVALLIAFLGGTAAAVFGEHGYLDVKRQRARFLELREFHAAHLKRVEDLKHEVDRLKSDPSTVERIAREDLGYVAKDEITLLLPNLDAKTESAIVPAVRKAP